MTENKKQRGMLSNLYLFTSEYENNEPVGPLDVVTNTFIFWGDPDEVSVEKQGRILMRTDEVGCIHHTIETVKDFESMTGPTGKPVMDYSAPFKGMAINKYMKDGKRDDQPQPLLLPPPEALSYIALSTPEGLDWRKELIQFLKEAGLPKFDLKFKYGIRFEDLVKPADRDENSLEYEEWYHHKVRYATRPLCGYILPRVRAVFFLVNNEVPVKSIVIEMPNGDKEPFDSDELSKVGDYNAVILQGGASLYPAGLYKISVELKETKKFNIYTAGCEELDVDGDNTYRLSAMVRFEIKTVLGRFDMINIDPVSVEEALIVQFPEHYKYLITSALTYKKEGKLPEGEAEGFTAYAKMWAASKEKCEAASGLLGHDLSVKIGRDAKGRRIIEKNGKKEIKTRLFWEAVKALGSDAVGIKETRVKATIEACLATKDAMDAWGALRAAARDHFGKHADAIKNSRFIRASFEAVRKKFFTVAAWSRMEDMEDFKKNTLFGRIGIPEQAAAALGTGLALAEAAAGAKAVYDHSLDYIRADRSLGDSVGRFKKICANYVEITGAGEGTRVMRVPVLFERGRHEIRPVYDKGLESGLLAELEGNDKRVFINGHTCNIGSAAFNQALSQRRAEALKAWLVDRGVDAGRITAVGHGITDRFGDNGREDGRVENRRCIAVFTQSFDTPAFACREGLNNLEMVRAKTVAAKLGKDEAAAAVLDDAFTAVLGLMAIVPHTAAAAAAIVLARTGRQLVAGLVNVVDELLLDHVLAAGRQDDALEETFLSRTDGNRALIYQLYLSLEDESDPDKQREIETALQLRIRAEAINGLILLLTYAALSAQGEGKAWERDYEQNIADYKIDKYIEHFLLSDQWIMPVFDFGPDLAQFWRYMANKHNLDFDKAAYAYSCDPETFKPLYVEAYVSEAVSKPVGKALNVGVNYKSLLNKGFADGFADSTIGKMFRGAWSLQKAGYYYATNAQARKGLHVTADFQRDFPVHCLASERVEGFVKRFAVTFGHLTDKAIAHVRFYFRQDRHAQWQRFDSFDFDHPLYDPKLRDYALTPFTELRVLVVLDPEQVTSVCPIYIQSVRLDGLNVRGPVYQEVARPLTKQMLLTPGEDTFLPSSGKQYYGAVFYPFFQFGGVTFLGTKPLAGARRLDAWGAERYHRMGFLRDMRYGLRCVVGKNPKTEKMLQLRNHSYPKDEYSVSIDTSKDPQAVHLVNGDFLKSNATAVDYTKLFTGARTAVPLVRLGGEDTRPYVAPQHAFMDEMRRHNSIIKQEAQAKKKIDAKAEKEKEDEAQKKIGPLYRYRPLSGGRLAIEGFDWQTPVDIIVVVACNKLDTTGYTNGAAGSAAAANTKGAAGSVAAVIPDGAAQPKGKQNVREVRRDWRRVPCDLTLEEAGSGLLDFDGDLEGPTYSSSLYYLGEMTAETTGSGQTTVQFIDKSEPIEVLKPVLAILRANDGRAVQLAGWDQYPVIRAQAKRRHIFAAHFRPDYQSPKGATVTCVRPFGKDKYRLDGTVPEPYFNYRIKSFTTAGTSGFDGRPMGAFYSDDNDLRYILAFSAPKRFVGDAPWTRPNPELVKRDADFFTSDFYQRIRDDVLTYEELIDWMENQSTSREYLALEAIRGA